MENTNKRSIVIDLAECMNARSFDSNSIIHQAEFNRCKELIDSKIQLLITNQNNNVDIAVRRYNDTITILGSRGSGKTSFLMSILKQYEKNDDVEIIELIDPTLIEEKGHIFLTLISLIKEKVENALSKNECIPCSKEYIDKSCWDKKLKKLAAGLPSIDIDSISLYSNWHDPEHVMKKGLESVKAAKELEKNFEDVVIQALKILGNKKAFIIAFDDIDVNFKKGWQVLETIRKYLTSRHIITLLSGDIKLFSKAIRKKQWDNFGNNLLIYEGEKLKRIDQFDDMVTELESQYLQKIMKTPNRIHLLTIGELINKNIIQIKCFKKENDTIKFENIPIYKHYASQLYLLGLKNKYEIHVIITYLLSLPLRTQIQLLKQFDNIKNENKNMNICNITDPFVSDMYELGIDVEHAKSQHKELCYIVHKFLIKEELLNETYQMLPTSGVAKFNAVLFSLNTLFVAHSKNNPYMFFEYWITIATIRNLLTIMPYRSELEKEVSLLPTIEGLAEYSFIGQNKVFRDICSHISIYIRETLNNKGVETKTPWGGTLILKGLAEIAKKKYEDRIDLVFKDEPTLFKRQLAFFPMSIASFPHKQQSMVVYSFYTLLGTIIEILKRINIANISEENTDTVREISVLLNELAQVKDYVVPIFDKTIGISSDEISYMNLEEDINDKENMLAKILNVWIKHYPKSVPPHLIGKIATRAFYAMRKLDDTVLYSDNQNLGDAMHRRIVIVLNSALVEDVKENLEGIALSNNNPLEKDDIFIDNLNTINSLNIDEQKKLTFSMWLLSCPLFLLYLNPIIEQQVKKQIKNSTAKYNKTVITEVKLFEKLDSFINIYSDLISNLNKSISAWFKENSIYNKLKIVSINAKVGRESRKSKLLKFSLSKKNIGKTVNTVKEVYKEPKDCVDAGEKEVREKLSSLFLPSSNFKLQIIKFISICRVCKTWDEVIDNVEKNNKKKK